MSLAHVLLGLLDRRSMTGYDLKTQCLDQPDQCMAHLWPADQAQIYRTLDKLEAQGWITCTVEVQHDRPNRKVYAITEAGQAELQQWLSTHQPLPIVREPLLVQLQFAESLSNEAIVALLEQERAAHRERLVRCQAIELPAVETADDREQQLQQLQRLQRLCVELLMRREELYLDWLEEAIGMIQ